MAICKSFNMDLNEKEAKRLMNRYDMDGSGAVDYNEFAQAFMQGYSDDGYSTLAKKRLQRRLPSAQRKQLGIGNAFDSAAGSEA